MSDLDRIQSRLKRHRILGSYGRSCVSEKPRKASHRFCRYKNKDGQDKKVLRCQKHSFLLSC